MFVMHYYYYFSPYEGRAVDFISSHDIKLHNNLLRLDQVCNLAMPSCGTFKFPVAGREYCSRWKGGATVCGQ